MDKQKNLFILNNFKETIGVLSNNMPFSLPFFSDIQDRNLDDFTNTLTLTIPANHIESHKIVAGNYILYPDINGLLLYKIMDVSEESGSGKYTKDVYCEVSAQDDLIKDVVRPISFNSASLSDILAAILFGTGWTVGNVDSFGFLDYSINDYPTKLKAIIDVVTAFGGELNFEYDTLANSTTVIAQKVSVYSQLGEETGKMFSYGLDLVGVKRTENNSKLVTAMIGVGKSDSNGNPMTFIGYDVNQLGGAVKFYEKPTNVDWIGSVIALEKYSTNGQHFFGVYKDDKASSPTELFQNTLKALQQYDRPLMTYSTSVALLSKLTGYEAHKVKIGDTIIVQDKSVKPELYIKARVRQLSRSVSNPEADSLELGDYIPLFPSTNKRLEQLQHNIRSKEQAWTEAKQKADEAEKIATETKNTVDGGKLIWDRVVDKADTSYVETVEKKVTYKVDIISTNGIIFKNGQISTTLLCRVYQGNVDITDIIDANRFRWTRVSADVTGDVAWNTSHFGGTKQVVVTTADVKMRATFNCEILDL